MAGIIFGGAGVRVQKYIFVVVNDNLDLILEKFRKSRAYRELAEYSAGESVRVISTGGLAGGMSSFLALSLKADHKTVVAVLPDKEMASYFFSNLDSLQPKVPKGFLPDSFKKPGDFSRLKKTQLQDRTEVINRLVTLDGNFLLVTYPEALFEKVLSPKTLEEKQIRIVKEEEIDVDFLIEILLEYGFSRVDFVAEPGEFSIRGGIIDLFSYGNDWPYRIELFDTMVESIRLFNPTDQLSVKEVERVSIVPNIESKVPGRELVSLFEILPEDALLVLESEQELVDRVQFCFDEARGSLKKVVSTEEEERARDYLERSPWVLTREVVDGLQRFKQIRLEANPMDEAHPRVVFNGSPQPNFNKNFKLLIEDLESHTQKGFQVFLFTDNPRQYNRIQNIFEDLGAKVKLHPVTSSIDRGFIEEEMGLVCYTDHQIFRRFHKYRVKRGFSRDQAIQLKMLKELKAGDFVTHMDHGVGRYSGLEKININGNVQESVRLIYKNNDILYVSIHSLHKISRYVGKDGTNPKLNKLGSDSWARVKRKTKKKVKDIARDLIKLYAMRKAADGFAFPEDGYLQNELEASFIYEDTPDQLTATQDVKYDMQQPHPMDRLICGDVGFGKTEVAIRAVFKAVLGGKQVAVLVPTTILALQHYRTFQERLSEFGLSIDYLNRFRTAAEKRKVMEKMEAGELDVVIGTHSLLNKNVKFKDLGLLVIDEEQKFGVAAKEKLRKLKVNVDTLTLTATPIPRTLQFSLMAARDMSVLRTAPPNRQPIHTEMRSFNVEAIKDAIYYEVDRGGQVFFVHNRVKTLPEIHQLLKKLCPDLDFTVAHGQMESNSLEKTLVGFIEGKADVLLCTNIIETGLDIANVNTIIINNAHQFGLSDLHQLRGRVGRSNRKAFCYLITPPLSALTTDARKRLKTIEEFSDLGGGFHIAMRDLDIRGAGSLLGAEQSGFIADIGYDAYQKVLEEAIVELKENEFKDVFKKELEETAHSFVRDVDIEMDVEMLIPDDYVSNVQERLNLYKEMDELKDESELEKFAEQLKDRFGEIPGPVFNLFDAFRIRWSCKRLGIERLTLKGITMKCFFLFNPGSAYYQSPVFNGIMQFVAEQGRLLDFQLKQSREKLILTKKNVGGLEGLKRVVAKLENAVKVEEV